MGQPRREVRASSRVLGLLVCLVTLGAELTPALHAVYPRAKVCVLALQVRLPSTRKASWVERGPRQRHC